VVLTIERLCEPGFLLQNRIVNNHDSFTVELPFTDKSKDTRAVRSNCVPIIFAGLWLACYVDYIADCLLTYFGMPKSNTCMYGVLSFPSKQRAELQDLGITVDSNASRYLSGDDGLCYNGSEYTLLQHSGTI
jgi:hypothetical protein